MTKREAYHCCPQVLYYCFFLRWRLSSVLRMMHGISMIMCSRCLLLLTEILSKILWVM